MLFAMIIGIFLAFYVGTFFGISDCKKQFGIPKHAMPEDVHILTVEEVEEIYDRLD